MKSLLKNNQLCITVSLIILAWLMLLPQLNKVFANETPGLACPPGWSIPIITGAICCPEGSKYALQSFNSNYCRFEDDNSVAPQIIVGSFSTYYCNSGSLRMDDISSFCFTPGTVMPDRYADVKGKTFVGCKHVTPSTNGGRTSPYRVEVDSVSSPGNYHGVEVQYDDPDYYIELDMCHGAVGGIFITPEEYTDGVCICDGSGENQGPAEDDDACNALCGGAGTIYGGSGAGACNGAKCCDGDQQCLTCVGDDLNGQAPTGRIYTSIGCIDPTREGIVVWLIRIALILTTAIGVFRFIQASFLIRSGDPEKIKEGQEIVTSAIIALVLVLLSVPLLQFIGVNVLGIFPADFI